MRYFVSGHRDLTMEEFDRHYVYQLDRVLEDDPCAQFVVGDWEGCDTIFVKYMEEYYTDVVIHIFYVFLSTLKRHIQRKSMILLQTRHANTKLDSKNFYF